MNYVETIWSNSTLNISNFSKELGFIKSQLHRELVSLSGKSANKFIREFRLHRALHLLIKQKGNVKETALATGFNSPTCFPKCFLDKFKILPSTYVQKHT